MPFLLSYFRTEDEALHLATSEDGLRWSALNGNQAVLRATVGNRSVRDPFIRRGVDGLYHLLSTDSWWSRNILHACSPDLVRWGPWELLPVMAGVEGARNAWAPEFVTDPVRQRYLIFWASIGADEPYQRMWVTETSDFHSLAPTRLLFDPGHAVIDATMVKEDGTVFMLFKDERGENRPGTDFKAMRVATAPDWLGPFTPRTELVTPSLSEGPAVFQADGRWLMLFDHFLDDRWGAAESDDLLHWQPVNGPVVPPGARHGSVLSISGVERDRLLSAFPHHSGASK